MAHSKRQLRKKPPKKKKPVHVVALLTDFSIHDHYVASMKGVILSVNPSAQIVDVTHEINPQRIQQAGYMLWSTYTYFPEGTVFVCVVDPGVGSARRIIGVRTKAYSFLAPDNGLLDFILHTEKVIEEIELTDKETRKYLPGNVSLTFHGRDVFAPLAGYLSKGLPLKQLGVSIQPQMVGQPFVRSQSDVVHPCVLHIDHFGNITTNLAAKDSDQAAKEVQAVSVGHNLVSRWVGFYHEAPEKTPCLLVGSSGLVEITVKNSNAARLLNVTLDTPVKVYWR